jgi:hypothetical protein
MNRVSLFILVLMIALASCKSGRQQQRDESAPDLQETLQWLEGATEAESAKGAPPYEHYGFRSEGECKATITEERLIDGKTKEFPPITLSLKDIDPTDIQVEDMGKGSLGKGFEGQSGVNFHTRNYQKTIQVQNPDFPGSRVADVTLLTNSWFAPKFAKALKRAVELCGGKSSSF